MTDDVQRSLGRIEGKLDQMLANQLAHDEDDKKRFDNYSRRIGSLERSRAAVWGAVVAVKAVVAIGFWKLFS